MHSIQPMDGSTRIVVVEDDDTLAVLLRYNLEYAGFTVEVVADGIEALQVVTARPPQLLILDWNVPRLSGIEVLRRLKRQSAIRLPIVMLTARTDALDRARALALGADAYVEKPFSTQGLIALMSSLINRESRPALEPESVAILHRGCARAG